MYSFDQLPFDVLFEISTHLSYKSHSLFSQTCLTNSSVINKEQLLCSYYEKNVKENDLYDEYTGEYKLVTKNDKIKKIKHGYGKFTKKTGKNIIRIYQGLFKNNVPINYLFTYRTIQHTTKTGRLIEETNKQYISLKNQPEKSIKIQLPTVTKNLKLYKDNLIKYFGEGHANIKHGYGVIREMHDSGSEMLTYCNFVNDVKHGFATSYINDGFSNPCIQKRIYCQYNMGTKTNNEYVLTKTFTIHNFTNYSYTLENDLTIYDLSDGKQLKTCVKSNTITFCKNYLFNNMYISEKKDGILKEIPYIDALKPCPCKFCKAITLHIT